MLKLGADRRPERRDCRRPSGSRPRTRGGRPRPCPRRRGPGGRAGRCGGSSAIEAVLERVDPLDELLEPLLALVLVEPEPVVGVTLRDPCPRSRGRLSTLSSIADDSRLPAMADRGSFHIGYAIDPKTGKPGADEVVIGSSDLTTHGVVAGMTGSGKTGLAVVLLEEALLAGIPTLVLDPKGDMTNLALVFPDLEPASFRPWVSEADAQAEGVSADDYAAKQATIWREGLAANGIGPERLQALKDAADVTIYTPGSTAGVPAQRRRLAARAAALVGHGGRGAPRRDRGHGDEPARARRDQGRPALEPRARPALEPDRERVARRPRPRPRHADRRDPDARRSASSACSRSTSSSRPPTARSWRSR